MTRLLALLAVVGLAAPQAGCVIVSKKPQQSARAGNCHPSQEWDGRQCRHKGKGHGARKHDGDGKPGKHGKPKPR